MKLFPGVTTEFLEAIKTEQGKLFVDHDRKGFMHIACIRDYMYTGIPKTSLITLVRELTLFHKAVLNYFKTLYMDRLLENTFEFEKIVETDYDDSVDASWNFSFYVLETDAEKETRIKKEEATRIKKEETAKKREIKKEQDLEKSKEKLLAEILGHPDLIKKIKETP